MNEVLDDIGKKLPYVESEQYIDDLIVQMTEKAIKRHHKKNSNKRWSIIAISTAASVVLVIGIGSTLLHKQHNTDATVALNADDPIDEFLNTLTDEEVAMLTDYEIEEIPEY